MSTVTAETTTFGTLAPAADQDAVSQMTWRPLVHFYSLVAFICLFLGHGAWVIYGLKASHIGSAGQIVSYLFLIFYAATLPGCAYFAWRQYRHLRK